MHSKSKLNWLQLETNFVGLDVRSQRDVTLETTGTRKKKMDTAASCPTEHLTVAKDREERRHRKALSYSTVAKDREERRHRKALLSYSLLLKLAVFSFCWTVAEPSFANQKLHVKFKERKASTLMPERSVEVFKCSRAKSRVAHEVLEEYLLPFVERQKYNLPQNCKLHGSKDMFLQQEKMKLENHPNSWKCGICSKLFKSEVFLDKHFDNRHAEEVQKELGCFANLCPLIHCDYHQRKKLNQKSGICKQSDLDKRRHLCEALAEQCFAKSEGSKSVQLNEFFRSQFCEAHTCDKNRKVFPLGIVRRRYESLYYAAVIFLVFFMVIFYGSVYFQQRNQRNQGDLRRLRPKDSKKAIHWGLLKKDKQY